MDKFAVDPQRGTRVAKVHSCDLAGADRRTGNALGEPRQNDGPRQQPVLFMLILNKS
ncbi:hypothetical protein HFN63_35280 [Rhizobium leguminosarum]|uniref:hypothetical protein n=1 Tax=Rhizobium leguminosarum TaxID=384 RepID=UPI001C984A0E|nr:hypothetical protein [Rhizobium leguminosarum]MBY5775235.1 hypothetical protein [Rhizobium leguminosarum]